DELMQELNVNNELIQEFNPDSKLMQELYADIEALHYQNKIDINTFINYSKKNILDEMLDNQEIVNFTRHSDNFINTEEPDNITKKVRSLQTTLLCQTNLESFFASNSIQEDEINYNITETDMFEDKKYSKISDSKLDT
ncbi:30181_t:CDS:2, partial [Racocetra persica]